MQCIKFIINYWCNWLRFFTFKLKIVQTNHTGDTEINIFCCQRFSSHFVCHDTHLLLLFLVMSCCTMIRPTHLSTPHLPCWRQQICSSSSPVGQGQWRIIPWQRWRWCTHWRIEAREPSRCAWPFWTWCRCAVPRSACQRVSPPLEFPWSVLWMEVIIRWEWWLFICTAASFVELTHLISSRPSTAKRK